MRYGGGQEIGVKRAMSEAYLASARQLREIAASLSNPAAREKMLNAAADYEAQAVAPRSRRSHRAPRYLGGRAESMITREPSEWMQGSQFI
jgi:hypothetical protein